jgi:hypothetical protein
MLVCPWSISRASRSKLALTSLTSRFSPFTKIHGDPVAFGRRHYPWILPLTQAPPTLFFEPFPSLLPLPRYVSPSPVRRLPPGLRHLPPPRLTTHQLIRRFDDQLHRFRQLIAAFGPAYQVGFTLPSHPNAVVVAPLHVCLGLQELIVGDFILLDVPPLENNPFIAL